MNGRAILRKDLDILLILFQMEKFVILGVCRELLFVTLTGIFFILGKGRMTKAMMMFIFIFLIRTSAFGNLEHFLQSFCGITRFFLIILHKEIIMKGACLNIWIIL